MTEAERNFVAHYRIGHLATADAAGVPHVVPVCFVVAGDDLYITIDGKPKQGTATDLKRLRNIAANPAVAVVVDRYDEDWTRLGWVMLRGKAGVLGACLAPSDAHLRIRRGAEHDRAQALLRLRYPQYRAMALESLPVIAVRIERVTSWGNLAVPD